MPADFFPSENIQICLSEYLVRVMIQFLTYVFILLRNLAGKELSIQTTKFSGGFNEKKIFGFVLALLAFVLGLTGLRYFSRMRKVLPWLRS